MIGIVLAAGKGTRLRPLTDDKPKAMVSLNNAPMIEYAFEQLLEIGVDKIVVVVGYKKEQIIERYGDCYDSIPLQYVEQEEQIGTADAVRQVDTDERFALIFCDSIFENFVGKSKENVIFTQDVSYEKAKEHGVVQIDETGRITGLVEKPDKPPTTKIVTGLYILPPEIIHYCETIEPSDRGEYEITDAINKYVSEGGVITARDIQGMRYNVNDKETLEEAENNLPR